MTARGVRQARRLFPFAFLLLDVLFFHWRILAGTMVLPWDIRTYHLPQALFVSKAFWDGELPLWNPYIYCGHPFAANIQTALYYPPRFVATMLGGVTSTRMLYSLEVELLAHIVLAGCFCYVLLRQLGLGRGLSLVGASSFQLGGFFASQVEHLGAIEGMAWLPFIWACILRLADRATLRKAIALSAALSMTVLCGFTPVTSVVFLSSGFLILLLLTFRRARPSLLTVFAVCCCATALLCAVVLLPAAELTLASVSRFRPDWIGKGGGLPVVSLLSLVWPHSYLAYNGNADITFLYLYSGGAVVAGFLLFILQRRFRDIPALSAMLPLSVLFMLGASTPFGSLYSALFPAAIRGMIYPQEWIAPFCLSLCIAGAWGLQGIVRSKFAAIAMAVVAICDLTWFGSHQRFNSADPGKEPGVTERAFSGSSTLLEEVRAFTNLSTPPARIDTIDDSLDWAGSAMITEVPTAGGEDPMALIRTIQARLAFSIGERWGYYYQAHDLQSPVLSALNVCCVLTRTVVPTEQLSRSLYSTAKKVPGGFLYFNASALPRFYLVHQTIQASGLEQSAKLLKQGGFRPAEAAIVEGFQEPPIGVTENAQSSVAVLSYRRNAVRLRTASTGPSFLASSETNYPGWEATVDGRPTQIYNTNVAFRGIALPPGQHEVAFRFRPAIVAWSLAVSVVSWLGLAALLFGAFQRGRHLLLH